ncbi:DUF6701 domain-containing protein [Sulfuricaulis sp.]|uniref:DUF6701 domain-containing protein n=1 Tax=Sulfuricaulis sp. TaxID=2003553 RepID=UPI00355978CF
MTAASRILSVKLNKIMNFRAEHKHGKALVSCLAVVLFLVFAFIVTPAQALVSFRAAASASAATGGVITYVNSGTVANAASGNVAPGYPAGWSAGDMLLCVVESKDNVVASMPAGWTTLSAANSGAAHRATIFWKIAAAGDSTTPTVTHTGGDSIIAQIIGFNGVDNTTPFDVANSFTVSPADLTTEAGAITTVSPNTMLVFTAHMADNHTSIGLPAGSAPWTQAFFSATNNGTDSSIAAHYGLRAAAGAQAAVTATRAGAAAAISHGAQIALRPAVGALTIPKPAGTLTADVMIASVSVTPSTITITPPVGWTLIRQVTQGTATTSKLATYYRVAGVGEPAGYTWTLSGGTHNGAVGGIASFNGVDNVTPYDAETGNSTASATTHTAPSVTTTLTNGMLVTVHEYASSGTWSTAAMNEAVDVASLAPNNAAGISMEMNYEIRPTIGATGTRTATATATADTGAVQSISLKPTPLICYTDDFNRANGSPSVDWVVSHNSGTFGDPVIFNNRLRLTDASGSAATTATLQRLFPGSGNRIEVEFDHFAYGGSGADGIALTLSDSAITAVPGAFGGSLGYAQKSNPGSDCTVPGGCPGFAGGWLGVGIDEYGNFSNPTEGRVGGPGARADSVSIRGSGSGVGATYGAGLPNYSYHTGTGTLAPGIDVTGATAGPGYRYRIIVDHANGVNAMVSVERNTGAGFTTLIPAYDAKVIAGQATVPTNWLLSYTGSTGGATNIHEIDNLQVCATTVTPLSGIHHFDITVGASASTCAAKGVTITAKDSSGNTLTGYTGTVTITTSTSHGDWSRTPTGTLVNGTPDDGIATYTFVAGDNGSVALSFTNTHADDLTFNVTDATVPSSSTTSSPVTSFRDSAFVITEDPIQIAGRNQTISVSLYTKVGGSCSADASYTGSKNLDAWLTLDAYHPAGASVPTIGALTLPTSAPASNPATNNLTLTFASGTASFAMSTTDVGKYILNLRDDTRLYATAVDLSGTSNSITTRPWLHVAVTGNPGASSAAGTVFTSAGTNFTATVRGVLWQAADDANNDGVPDSGANLANNSLAPRFAWDTVLSPTTPFTPATPSDAPAGTGTAGTLVRGAGGSTLTQASFSGGSASAADWRYSEVGSFTLRATASNYLNSGINVYNDNGVVGRFTPAYFDVTRIHGCPAGADPLLFTYSGQLFTVTATARAANSGTTTANYDGALGFAKATTVSNAGNAANFTNNTLAAGNFVGGARTQSTVTYTFPAKETAPATLTLRAIDTDSVSSVGHTEEQTQIRSGRVRLYNAYGSELVTLSMPMRVEYYEDTTVSAPATNPPITGWVTNSADTCTSLSLPNLDLQNAVHDPAQGVATINIKTGPNIPSTVTVVSPTAGVGELSFSAPGAGGDGYADARMDLAARSWLQFDWNGTGNTDPTGRATFGLYRGSPKHIYLRQRYN